MSRCEYGWCCSFYNEQFFKRLKLVTKIETVAVMLGRTVGRGGPQQRKKYEELSQYQTNTDAVVKTFDCLARAVESPNATVNSLFSVWIEPSAGHGAFYDALPPNKRRGCDIDRTLLADHPDYFIGDFLKMSRDDLQIPINIPPSKCVVIGNPPFSEARFQGGLKNLVIDFINHAGDFADTIAFIVPRTMLKPAFQDRVRSDFILAQCQNLSNADCIFNIHDDPDNLSVVTHTAPVSCCIQVWVRSRPRTTTASSIAQRQSQLPESSRSKDLSPQAERTSAYAGIPNVHRRNGTWSWNDGTDGDFSFVYPVDSTANLLVCRFGNVGVTKIDPMEIEKIQSNLDHSKSSAVSVRGASMYFYLVCNNPEEVSNVLTSRFAESLFAEYRDACIGKAASINLRDVVRVYVLSLQQMHQKSSSSRR